MENRVRTYLRSKNEKKEHKLLIYINKHPAQLMKNKFAQVKAIKTA
jgi:hypothetical protein